MTNPGAKGARRSGTRKPVDDEEQQFVLHYLACFNQSEAARRAGIKKDANIRGYQFMQRPSVRAAIDRKLAEISARLDTKAEDVLREMVRMAMFDPAHVSAVTCPEDIAQLPEDIRRAIVGWSWDKQGRFTIKMAKETMLPLLAKHHGLLKEQVEHSGKVSHAVELSDEQLAAIATAGRG